MPPARFVNHRKLMQFRLSSILFVDTPDYMAKGTYMYKAGG